MRKTIKEFAYKQHLNFEEKPFSVQEALNAKEIFLTGTRTKILPVTHVWIYPKMQGKNNT